MKFHSLIFSVLFLKCLTQTESTANGRLMGPLLRTITGFQMYDEQQSDDLMKNDIQLTREEYVILSEIIKNLLNEINKNFKKNLAKKTLKNEVENKKILNNELPTKHSERIEKAWTGVKKQISKGSKNVANHDVLNNSDEEVIGRRIKRPKPCGIVPCSPGPFYRPYFDEDNESDDNVSKLSRFYKGIVNENEKNIRGAKGLKNLRINEKEDGGKTIIYTGPDSQLIIAFRKLLDGN